MLTNISTISSWAENYNELSTTIEERGGGGGK